MADLTSQERLQPSLLDRLTDEEPGAKAESRDKRVLSLSRLRESVIRDLGWLLNTGHLESVVSLEALPQVKSSALNYGMPDLTGIPASGIDTTQVEKTIRRSILTFEPRILAQSLVVRVEMNDAMNHNAMTFLIEGELWAQPLPVRLYLRTEVDLETGTVTVLENAS